jgi:hypothetical protein
MNATHDREKDRKKGGQVSSTQEGFAGALMSTPWTLSMLPRLDSSVTIPQVVLSGF